MELKFEEKEWKVFIMELIIGRRESNDDETVKQAHEKNLEEATKQVKSYRWTKSDCKNVQKIVCLECGVPNNRQKTTA